MKAKDSHKSSIKSAIRHIQGLTKLSTIMEVTVRGMFAYSHPCDRDISMSYTADSMLEHTWTTILKPKSACHWNDSAEWICGIKATPIFTNARRIKLASKLNCGQN